MSRRNHIDFVQMLYEFNPKTPNWKILDLVSTMFPGHSPSAKTLSVWKARLRKKGVFIPDLRKVKK